MRLPVALLSHVLFATTVFAAQSGSAEQVSQRPDRRFHTGSDRPISVPAISRASRRANTNHERQTNYQEISPISAGASISGLTNGLTIYAVLGTFVVPLPSPTSSGPGTWQGGAWVGLNQADIGTLLQAGVGWSVTVNSTGGYSYGFYLWYEWFPAGPTNVPMAVDAGDVIDVWCEVTTPSTAFCIINNISTGVENTYELSAPTSNPAAPTEADWIVEKQGTNANFGAVTFTNCFAIAGRDFIGSEFLYPNSSTANTINMVAASGSTEEITAVYFPASSNNAVEINYIKLPS